MLAITVCHVFVTCFCLQALPIPNRLSLYPQWWNDNGKVQANIQSSFMLVCTSTSRMPANLAILQCPILCNRSVTVYNRLAPIGPTDMVLIPKLWSFSTAVWSPREAVTSKRIIIPWGLILFPRCQSAEVYCWYLRSSKLEFRELDVTRTISVRSEEVWSHFVRWWIIRGRFTEPSVAAHHETSISI